jgi:cephalosporin hydroxylase
MSLLDLIDNSRTDKNTNHSYLETYEHLFQNKKNTAQNILEIGVQEGGSIKLWYDYFKNATIYGLDIRKIKDIWPELKNKPRIKLGCFDAYDSNFVENQMKPLNVKFDIMIDDGPHTLESMISFIEYYLPMLSDDGIFVIEDVQSFDWIETLTNVVPNEMKQFIEVYDLRENKDRYDDILFVINKTN